MVRYRRNFVPGGTYFFTVTLDDRTSSALVDHISALRRAFRTTRQERPFTIEAIVVLPEHLHAIWTLPSDDSDFSGRWKRIKTHFTHRLVAAGVPIKRHRSGEYALWQRRFWEHTIRNEADFERHVDYVHFNPIKHRLVSRARDWPYSSFHVHVRRGLLPADWRAMSTSPSWISAEEELTPDFASLHPGYEHAHPPHKPKLLSRRFVAISGRTAPSTYPSCATTRRVESFVPPQSALLNVMTAAARKAGRSLKRDFGEVSHLQVSLKGPANFVSAADHRAEEILRAELLKARPGYGFLGEESGSHEGSDRTHTWVVDPLDGTTNFLHSIPHFAISIALVRDGTPIAGLIYNPANDEFFTAERGKGAFFNDRRIRVAARKRLVDAVVCCALPHHGRGDLALFRREMAAIQDKVAGLRRFGAAALDLAYVAAGRFDAYWERGLAPWDFAAGVLLVREAGGFVTDLADRERTMEAGDIIAGNEFMHRELLGLIAGA